MKVIIGLQGISLLNSKLSLEISLLSQLLLDHQYLGSKQIKLGSFIFLPDLVYSSTHGGFNVSVIIRLQGQI